MLYSLCSCRCARRAKDCHSPPSSRRGAADDKRGPAAPLQRSAAEQTAQRGRNAARRILASVPPATWLPCVDDSGPGWQRRRLSTRRARKVTSCEWRRPCASLACPAACVQALPECWRRRQPCSRRQPSA